MIQPGDKVRYTGSGVSALDGGPGEVVTVSIGRGELAKVRVLHPVTVCGNEIEAGEVLLFPLDKLALYNEHGGCLECEVTERPDGTIQHTNLCTQRGASA